MTIKFLKPFWNYYGGKFRDAPRYPAPVESTIVEPFAGAAGYGLRHYQRNVILVEKYPVIAEMWRYLIAVSAAEVRRIPLVDSVNDLPSWVPAGARYLIGFCMNDACTEPRTSLSAGRIKLRQMGRKFQGWGEGRRERVASQVDKIRHWKIVEGDYTQAPDVRATWFIDPPYSGPAGRYYKHREVDYEALGEWCHTRNSHVIVCENEGADWLPFQPFSVFRQSVNGGRSREMAWERRAYCCHPRRSSWDCRCSFGSPSCQSCDIRSRCNDCGELTTKDATI